MKNVMLKIEGKQTDMDGEENNIELITEGKMYEKGTNVYLVYEETEISGMNGCTTTLKLAKDKINLKRFGKLNSQIVFEKGKKYMTDYQTPYGVIDMEVTTTDVDYSITDAKKGAVSIEYIVNLKGLSESINKLNITIM